MSKEKKTKAELMSELTQLQTRVKELEGSRDFYSLQEDLEWQRTELYQKLIMLSPCAIILTDVDGIIIVANKAAAQIHGFKHMEEVIGKSLFDFVLTDEKKRATHDKQDVLSGEPFNNVEYIIIKADGSHVNIEVSASAIRDKHSEPHAIMLFLTDITERKKVEQVLRSSALQYRTILDSMPTAIHVVNRDLQFILLNKRFQAWQKELGLEESDVVGKTVLEVFPFLDNTVQEEYQRVFSSGKILTTKESVHMGRKDIYTETWKIPVWEEEVVTHVVTVVQDVTERKHLDDLKDEFINTVSHELRTPLSIIKGGISVLLNRIPGQLTEKQQEILLMARDNTNRLVRIVTDLLSLTSFDAGKVQLRKKRMSLTQVIDRLVGSFALKVQQKGIELRTHFSKENIEIFADEDRMMIVFTNLLGNAVKFTQHGAIDVFVTEKDDVVECRVADTGIGIAKGDLPNVFNKFQQFSRVAGKSKEGTGLGLPITKKIIEMHSGRIEVKSKYRKGTEFTIILPQYQETEDENT